MSALGRLGHMYRLGLVRSDAGGGGPTVPYSGILALSGDMTGGTDTLLLSGDMQSGTDGLTLSGNE